MAALRLGTQVLLMALLVPACGAPERSTVIRGVRSGQSLAAGSGAAIPNVGGARAGSAAGPVVPPPGGPLLPRAAGVAKSGGINPKVCASAVVQAAKTPPIVVFVVDGSGSMCAPYGSGGTRWQALRGALLEPSNGLIYRLQNQVKFGSLLYDGTVDLALALLGGGGPPGAGGPIGPGGPGGGGNAQNPPCALAAAMNKMSGMCPQLLYTPAEINNAMAIDMAYPPLELGGSTPTDRAMKQVMDSLIPMVGVMGPDDKKPSEIYVILATDGAPNDICVGGVGGDGAPQRAGVISEVTRGADEGVTTWVISLADDPSLQAHLDEVARAGAPKDPAAHTFNPASPDELVQTLAQLLGGAVGCNIALNGRVTVGQECLGTVLQNGMPVPCCQADAAGAWKCNNAPTTTPNGWRLTDPGSIELLGDSCTQFLLGSADLVNAEFPCEIFSPN
ncbi:MAG TPA: VWA domain-containing protein [Polyangiales bacterium]|jgi:hypothetical protein|nr:VWA domain-containing protein [Polyangiales bacterium]